MSAILMEFLLNIWNIDLVICFLSSRWRHWHNDYIQCYCCDVLKNQLLGFLKITNVGHTTLEKQKLAYACHITLPLIMENPLMSLIVTFAILYTNIKRDVIRFTNSKSFIMYPLFIAFELPIIFQSFNVYIVKLLYHKWNSFQPN